MGTVDTRSAHCSNPAIPTHIGLLVIGDDVVVDIFTSHHGRLRGASVSPVLKRDTDVVVPQHVVMDGHPRGELIAEAAAEHQDPRRLSLTVSGVRVVRQRSLAPNCSRARSAHAIPSEMHADVAAGGIDDPADGPWVRQGRSQVHTAANEPGRNAGPSGRYGARKRHRRRKEIHDGHIHSCHPMRCSGRSLTAGTYSGTYSEERPDVAHGLHFEPDTRQEPDVMTKPNPHHVVTIASRFPASTGGCLFTDPPQSSPAPIGWIGVA